MPFIPNFPPALLEEHRLWHHAHHYEDPSQLPQGFGQEFLNFHRQYIGKVLQWYKQQGYDPRLMAPWKAVPEGIRSTPCYNRQAENRLQYAPQSFATADELGLFIEGSNLHGCIHQEAARLYGEEALNDFDYAPQSTVFYNIHGMIDNWYKQWEAVNGNGRMRRGGAAAMSKGRVGPPGAQVRTNRNGRKK